MLEFTWIRFFSRKNGPEKYTEADEDKKYILVKKRRKKKKRSK